MIITPDITNTGQVVKYGLWKTADIESPNFTASQNGVLWASLSAVSDGYRYWVHSFQWAATNTSVSRVLVMIEKGSSGIALLDEQVSNPVGYHPTLTNFVLSPGCYLKCAFISLQAGERVEFGWFYSKSKMITL